MIRCLERTSLAAAIDMMNFDTMSPRGRRGPHRAHRSGCGDAQRGPVSDVVVNNSRVSSKTSGKAVSFADIVKSGK